VQSTVYFASTFDIPETVFKKGYSVNTLRIMRNIIQMDSAAFGVDNIMWDAMSD
jgi:hypothetical protein